jgi:hypothetical protein
VRILFSHGNTIPSHFLKILNLPLSADKPKFYFYNADTLLELIENGTMNLESKIKFSLRRRAASRRTSNYHLGLP